jgi:SAM-dependent methyltransferase
MFTKTAAYYDALYHFKDYRGACQRLHKLIQQLYPTAATLLDVACGTGKHLEYLQENYQVAGLDLNPDLIAVARQRCPEVPLFVDDMTSFELGRTFDVVVCLFSSIAYVQTVDKLNEAVQRMTRHLKPAGLLFVEPWITPEKYWLKRITANFVDQPDLKISWMYTSERVGDTSVFDIHYTVGTPEGVSAFTEKHVMGLWTDEQYRQALQNAGVNVHYDHTGLMGRGMYYGQKN